MTSNTRSHVLLTLGVLFTVGGATRFIPTTLAEAEASKPADQTEIATPARAELTKANHSSSADQSTPARPLLHASGSNEVCFSGETAKLMAEDSAQLILDRENLHDKEMSLEEWQAELKAQSAELKTIRETLEARWQTMQEESETDLTHLAQMYGSMKPDQAAQIFDKMDPSFAAGSLRKLSTADAGLIMANMATENAYIVSVRLDSIYGEIINSASSPKR